MSLSGRTRRAVSNGGPRDRQPPGFCRAWRCGLVPWTDNGPSSSSGTSAMHPSLLFVIGLSLFASGGAFAEDPQIIPLWPPAPGGAASDPGDENHSGDIPTITVYLAPKEK